MPTNINLDYIRACALQLGADAAKIKELEQSEYRQPGDWDDDRAARFWSRASGYEKKLDIPIPSELDAGYAVEIPYRNIVLIESSGPKRTKIRRIDEDGSVNPAKTLRTGSACRTLMPIPDEALDEVQAMLIGFGARKAIDHLWSSSLMESIVLRQTINRVLKRVVKK